MNKKPPVRIIRAPSVLAITGESRTNLYERINPKSTRYDATFPRPVKLGERTVGWYEHEVVEWAINRERA